jgi:diguanylate cyclase (GGDEF)-like protein
MNTSFSHESAASPLEAEGIDVGIARGTEPVTPWQRKRATLACLLIALVTAALIPVSTFRLPEIPAFLPAYQTALITAYLITAYLIFSFYRASRSLSLLYLCGGCVYTAVILIVQFLSFPNLLVTPDATVGGPQTTIWLWCFWHLGPPLAILGYGLSEWLCPGLMVSHPYRTARRFGVGFGAVLMGSIAAVTLFHDWLPVLDINGHFHNITTTGIAPGIQVLILVALLVLWRATRFETGLNMWLGVALIALLLDNAITMTGGSQLSVGWYVGRLNALLSAVIMLAIYLREINCVYLHTVRNAHRLAVSNALLEVKADQARLDSLTGLPGRSLFLEQASALHARGVATGAAFAVLFIDLDGFKEVNDNMGHEHGDFVLRKTAEVLRSVMRESDVAGRVGGDEFVVALISPAGSIQATATAVAERVVGKIGEIGNGVGCSVGISLCNDGRHLLESSLRQADAAMYEAKKNGKNRFVVYLPEAA